MKALLILITLLILSLTAQAQTNTYGSATLAWSPSPGTNVIAQYKIYYGVASGTYTNSISAGTNLTLTVTSLRRGVRYYFAATAKDTQGLESDYSLEVSAAIPAPPPPPTSLTVIVN